MPATIAISQVGRERKTPMIGLSPIQLQPSDADWTVTVAQPPQLMIDAVVERMQRDGVKYVGYIGFSDAWGDLVYNALVKAAEPVGIKVVTNERYARADASVAGQVLKIVDRAYLLEVGRIKACGPSQELAASDEIRKAYMGI